MGLSGRFGKDGDSKRNISLMKTGKGFHLRYDRSFNKERIQDYFRYKKDIEIRRSQKGHLEFITELSRTLFSIYGEYGEPARDWFLSPETISLVALFKREPVGFIMLGISSLIDMDPVSREILAVGVSPEFQRQGIGSALLLHIEGHAVEKKIPRIYLHTACDNITAKGLFHRMGYRDLEVRPGFYPSGHNAILMYKTISD